jgi:AraC-like DNA-binding protein
MRKDTVQRAGANAERGCVTPTPKRAALESLIEFGPPWGAIRGTHLAVRPGGAGPCALLVSRQRRCYKMAMTTFAPQPRLRTRVVAIDVVESAGGQSLVLPSTSAVLGFQFRGRVQVDERVLSLSGVTGIQDGARSYSYLGATGSVLVRFTPQGAASLGVPVGELTNRSVPLEDLMPHARVVEVTERLQAAPDDAARVAVVEQLLLELPFAHDPLVSRAIARLSDPETVRSVAAIAEELGISERQLERRFVARVGLMPKRFARLARFERAVSLVASAPSLAAAAQHAGYYDQPHFIREFRSFAGIAPAAWLSSR